ncbi:UNVERIFIED_CONTAM: hypothetical protein Sradi_3172100 [Sesamum radiatum]|uniref:Uncharacterized protein n=1 Tax=Sesamum radiatum TaxID=300843 RepID=A0AAW2RF63_SESRA
MEVDSDVVVTIPQIESATRSKTSSSKDLLKKHIAPNTYNHYEEKVEVRVIDNLPKDKQSIASIARRSYVEIPKAPKKKPLKVCGRIRNDLAST